jgi:hypothetical protein
LQKYKENQESLSEQLAAQPNFKAGNSLIQEYRNTTVPTYFFTLFEGKK